MSEEQSIFSFVLDSLADKPSQNQTQLFRDVKQKLKDDGIEVKNLKKHMDATINVAQDLGLLTVQDDAVKSLFQLKATPPEVSDAPVDFDDPEPEDRSRRRRSRRRSGSRRRSRSRRSRRRRR